MQYIFDFDDVLFNNTAQFKKHMFRLIAQVGVPEDVAKAYYLEVREKEFSLKNFIITLFVRYDIRYSVNDIYEKIIQECSKFVNTELIKEVKKIGKDNCYIITNGEQEFNSDKLKFSGIGHLFKEIYIVPGSKKEIINKICDENKNEQVVFIDDKPRFFEDLDFAKYPNLKTILYTGQDLSSILLQK